MSSGPHPSAPGPATPVALTAAVSQRWPGLLATLVAAGLHPTVRPRASLGAEDVVLVHPSEPCAPLGDGTGTPRLLWVVDGDDAGVHVAALQAGAHGVLPADCDAGHLRLVVQAALHDHVVVPAAVAQGLVGTPA